MADRWRIQCQAAADKVVSAEEAAAFISPGDRVGMSGFTGSGHPKAVPAALIRRVADAAGRGEHFAVSVWTVSTAPELSGGLAAVDGIDLQTPCQSQPGDPCQDQRRTARLRGRAPSSTWRGWRSRRALSGTLMSRSSR